MKITVFDPVQGDKTLAVVTDKEAFDKIVKEGMQPFHAVVMRTGDEVETVPRGKMDWDHVKEADEITLMPGLAGG